MTSVPRVAAIAPLIVLPTQDDLKHHAHVLYRDHRDGRRRCAAAAAIIVEYEREAASLD